MYGVVEDAVFKLKHYFCCFNLHNVHIRLGFTASFHFLHTIGGGAGGDVNHIMDLTLL